MDNQPNYKWYILFLTALTGAFGLAAPFMSLSVLFKEISADLHLNLVQVGLVWSIGSLPAIFISMLSGAINDRFGPKRVILTAVLLLGAAGASRGLAADFPSLLIAVIFFGLLSPMISTSAFKICGLWFPGRQLGLANGVFAAGMALGFFISSLVSANVLSVWLGGWRQVMFFYGGLTTLLCIPWYFARSTPKVVALNVPSLVSIPMRQALSHVVKLKDIWLLSIALMGMSGCMQGITGYIPTYLRGLRLAWSTSRWGAVPVPRCQYDLRFANCLMVRPAEGSKTPVGWNDGYHSREWYFFGYHTRNLCMGSDCHDGHGARCLNGSDYDHVHRERGGRPCLRRVSHWLWLALFILGQPGCSATWKSSG